MKRENNIIEFQQKVLKLEVKYSEITMKLEHVFHGNYTGCY
jgi:hypothetical protein